MLRLVLSPQNARRHALPTTQLVGADVRTLRRVRMGVIVDGNPPS